MATAPRILTDTGWVRPSLGLLITLLVDGGVLDQADGFSAETIAQRQDLPTADVLISKFDVAHFTIAQAYSTLAAVAAYKGLLELAWKPYDWDRTTHGCCCQTLLHRRRIQFQTGDKRLGNMIA